MCRTEPWDSSCETWAEKSGHQSNGLLASSFCKVLHAFSVLPQLTAGCMKVQKRLLCHWDGAQESVAVNEIA